MNAIWESNSDKVFKALNWALNENDFVPFDDLRHAAQYAATCTGITLENCISVLKDLENSNDPLTDPRIAGLYDA